MANCWRDQVTGSKSFLALTQEQRGGCQLDEREACQAEVCLCLCFVIVIVLHIHDHCATGLSQIEDIRMPVLASGLGGSCNARHQGHLQKLVQVYCVHISWRLPPPSFLGFAGFRAMQPGWSQLLWEEPFEQFQLHHPVSRTLCWCQPGPRRTPLCQRPSQALCHRRRPWEEEAGVGSQYFLWPSRRWGEQMG